MADSPSTERPTPPQSPRRRRRRNTGVLTALSRLSPDEQLAALGAAAVWGSLLLPWYGVPEENDLVQTGLGSFGFAAIALLLTVTGVLWLLVEVGYGYKPPRPLEVSGMLIAAGTWASLIVIYLMFDRPEFDIGGDQHANLRYGIFITFAGAIAIGVAGARARAQAGAPSASADS